MASTRNLEQLNTIADACSADCGTADTNGDYLDTLTMLAETGQLSASDGSIKIDTALDEESANAVQNKVIARLIPTEANSVNRLADKSFVLNQIAAHAEDYVAKEDGKGLSSCDFTLDLANKLVSLENYNDSDLRNQIINKVDKVEGKGLSTNDFTNEYKTKLDELTSPDTNNLQSLIASKADVNHTHDEYLVLSDLDGKVDKVAGKGLSTNDYTDEEKAKVEALNTFGENFNNQLANKVDKVEGKGLSTNDYTTEEKEKLASLSNFNDSSLRELIATKAEVSHSHTEYIEKAELDRKVDKVDGKELSTNDFTNEYKTKLDTLVSYNDAELQEKITNIESLIPNQASETNRLADKAFVNSSIATASAKFIGTFNSLASLQQSSSQDINDYAFVHGLDDLGNTTYNRYKWNGTEWLFEYKLNNSSFTAEQWEAINSGITADIIDNLVVMDDSTTSNNSTWSSNKIVSELKSNKNTNRIIVSLGDNESFTSKGDSYSWYKVLNGVCYYQFFIQQENYVNPFIGLVSGMPVPLVEQYCVFAPYHSASKDYTGLQAYISRTGVFCVGAGGAGNLYMLSGSYLVE